MAENKVIYAVSKKDSETQSPREIEAMGPELKYVGALPTSNNYNFEEEILLGEDKIIEKENNYYDPDTLKRCYHEKRYYTNIKSNLGYYYLEYFEYDTRANEDYDYRTRNSALVIDLDNSAYESVGGSSTLAKKFKLFYRKENLEEPSGYEDILIATKVLNITTKTQSGIKRCMEQYSWV